MNITFFRIYITENEIRVVGFCQNQISFALYGYRNMGIAFCGAWLYFWVHLALYVNYMEYYTEMLARKYKYTCQLTNKEPKDFS